MALPLHENVSKAYYIFIQVSDVNTKYKRSSWQSSRTYFVESSGGPWVFALGIHKGRRGDDASRGLASGKNSKTCPLESRKMPPILKIKLFQLRDNKGEEKKPAYLSIYSQS